MNSGALAADIPSVGITPVFLHGGAFPADPANSARIPSVVQAGNFLLDGALFPASGVEDGAGTDLPANLQAILSDLFEVDGVNFGIEMHFPTTYLTPDIELDGSPWPAASAESGRLFLAGDGGFLELGPTNEPLEVARVLQGRYDLLYAYTDGSTVPENFLQAVTCFEARDCLFCDGLRAGGLPRRRRFP